ncbi:putative multicomponent Na+:H+ antiporter subunit B [Marinitoga hydrogenitolerans DSM 16785]|uniref:Multicomponent Na+:H+ antiporter subunit B n=1 Tax=Marinitoga hydrogenitolerans (strain DSM 16785 / JCM 12826 / AT1271) TaxID=1122195 RepID=A0A1M4SLU1_MARH1|nr:transporter substrate-binding domain-containing protein [Marinitoga hydrogenitolerans]SHE33166.1 putative multicomponent Na+:H+ antiporter subunit B [Marinitoga hydrogenitolerans DSM 16785]
MIELSLIENIFLISLIILAFIMLFVKKYINAILIYAAFGTILSGVFFIFNAPDVAAVQMTIGSAFIIFVYIIAIKTRSKITVGYVETPYLFEKHGDKLLGFEKDLLDNFSENSFFEIEYIPIKKEKLLEYINNNEFDIIAGGIIIENENECNYIFSKKYLPTKLFEYKGKIDPNYESIVLNNQGEKKIIDYLRLKNYFRKNSDIEVKEISSNSYRFIFSKNNKALKDDFNRFLKTFLNSKEYESIVRRNIG